MNPLNEALPPIVRKYLYAVLFVAATAFTIWQASDGNWLEFAGGLVTALLGLLAASNTSTGDPEVYMYPNQDVLTYGNQEYIKPCGMEMVADPRELIRGHPQTTFCVKPLSHPNPIHEDAYGNTSG